MCREDECFGRWEDAVLTDKNPAVALKGLKRAVDAGISSYPRVYMACGTEDDLIDANRSFRDKLINAGADVSYTEEPGRHDWNFWDAHIRRAIKEWLPI